MVGRERVLFFFCFPLNLKSKWFLSYHRERLVLKSSFFLAKKIANFVLGREGAWTQKKNLSLGTLVVGWVSFCVW